MIPLLVHGMIKCLTPSLSHLKGSTVIACSSHVGGNITTGIQQSQRGRSQSYGGQDTPSRRAYLPHSNTNSEKGSGGETIVLSECHLTPYENTGEGDLSDGDDVGGTIELGQSSARVSCDECGCEL